MCCQTDQTSAHRLTTFRMASMKMTNGQMQGGICSHFSIFELRVFAVIMSRWKTSMGSMTDEAVEKVGLEPVREMHGKEE